MKQLRAKVLSNDKVAEGFYRMRIESAYLAKNTKPGQFIEVRCSDDVDPLLRRPLGAHRISRDGIDILYEVVGKGTEILARKKKGKDLDVIGPLGNGFKFNHPAILVAGGIGVAPLVALAEKLSHRSPRPAWNEGRGRQVAGHKKNKGTHVIIGAKKGSHILCEKEFKNMGCDVKIATEDGSKGHKGLATDLLKNILLTMQDASGMTLYACGPTGMLKAVAAIAKDKNIPCQVSLEERMACGVGVCLGCPVKVKNQFTNDERRTTNHEYKMVCKDGPVFDAEEIAW